MNWELVDVYFEQKWFSPNAQNARKRGMSKEQFCVSVISVAKQKHSHRMHGIHGKEECSKSNSVFFVTLVSKKRTLTECTEYTEKRNVQRASPCFL